MLSSKLIVIGVLALSSQMTKHKLVTCWVPNRERIKMGVDAGLNGDLQTLARLFVNHAYDSATRCWYGPPAEEQILEAAENGDVEQAVALTEAAADPATNAMTEASTERTRAILQTTNAQGETPLHLASARGDVAMARVFLSKGASVNKPDLNGLTSLMKAAMYGDVDMVDELLKNGADANAQALNGSTALMFASAAGHEGVVTRLIQQGCDLDRQKDDGHTALMLASRDGRIEVVRALTKAGALLNLVKNDGWNALMLAAHNGRLSIVKHLVEGNADCSLKENEGNTAKSLADRRGLRQIAEILKVPMLLAEKMKLKESKKDEFAKKLLLALSTMSVNEKNRLSGQLLDSATEPPQGIYQESCRNIVVANDELTASCKKDDATYETSSLKLPCAELIANVNGQLKCTIHASEEFLPVGPYRDTCTSCSALGGLLTCKCDNWKYDHSELVASSLRLPCKGKIENRKGELKCE